VSPAKKKPTLADFFGDSDDEESTKSTPRIAGIGAFKFNGLNGCTNGDAKWKAVDSPKPSPVRPKPVLKTEIISGNSTVAPTSEMPQPVQMPQPITTPQPVTIPIEEFPEPKSKQNSHAFENSELISCAKNHVPVKLYCPDLASINYVDPEVLSDGMDISDSDEYDENDDDFINSTITWAKAEVADVKPEPDKLEVPLSIPVPCPPPPVRRKSRFSSMPNSEYDSQPLQTEQASPARESSDLTKKENTEEEIKKEEIEEEPPMPEFKVIDEPHYRCNKDFVRAEKSMRNMDCECRLPDDDPAAVCCGDECINRATLVECSSRCKTGDRCTNKDFQRGNNAPVEVFWTKGKGHGLRAISTVKAGTFIMEYLGEVVSAKEFKKRSHEYARLGTKHHYFMELSQQATIDAYHEGSISRFINHSCEPNAETQKWTVNGIVRIGFFSTKEIQRNQEVTFDYQFIHFGKAQTCLCGAPSCRGVIGREADVVVDWQF